MEIVKNRYGNDRVIEKISPTKLRVTGESLFSRSSEDAEGNHIMYDFEGGPCLNIGGKIQYMKTNWTITKISPEPSGKENLAMVILDIKL